MRDRTSAAWLSNEKQTASAEAEDIMCYFTRGCGRRSLCLALVLNIIGTAALFACFLDAGNAGRAVVRGNFCLHDNLLCPTEEFQTHPTLGERPKESICSLPPATATTFTTSTTSTTSTTPTNSSTTPGVPCIAQSTADCVIANGLSQTLLLIDGIIDDGRMRLLNVPNVERWTFVGIGVLALHTIVLMMLEMPLHRASYSWASSAVPERIFTETLAVIAAVWLLKLIVLGLLGLTVYTAYSFPWIATCEEINLFPENDDIASTVGSRKQFLAECQTLHQKCHVRLRGIASTWTEQDKQNLTEFLVGTAISALTILGASFWKWTVWSCCVADTVIDDDSVQMMDLDHRDERERRQREQFDEAIRRIQLKRKIERERKMYGERSGVDDDDIWDGETVSSVQGEGRSGENGVIREEEEKEEVEQKSSLRTPPTSSRSTTRTRTRSNSTTTAKHVTLLPNIDSSGELRPPTPGMFATQSYLYTTSTNGQPIAQSVTQMVDERTGRIVTPTKKTRPTNKQRRNSPAKGSLLQTPIEKGKVLESLVEREKDENPSNEDGVPICIICLDLLMVTGSSEGDREAIRCGHVFHSPCIRQWFEEGGQGHLCPICRTDVSVENENEVV